jgi:hypothetical protein
MTPEEIKENSELTLKIVRKLIGSIRPVGSSETDSERFGNLVVMCEVVNELITNIDSVGYDFKDYKEASIKRASDYASEFLTKKIGIIN